MFDPLTTIVMAVIGLKRSLLSNTPCLSNLYLFKCLKKYKFKSYLNSFMMTIGKDLTLARKKLDCLRMKMCKGVHLRRVKVKGLARIRQLRESTIPTNLSSKHEVCFMMKAFLGGYRSLCRCILILITLYICANPSNKVFSLHSLNP